MFLAIHPATFVVLRGGEFLALFWLNQYVDDTSIEVTLYRPFGRKEVMDGGYGTEDEDLRRILYRYITGFIR